MAMTPFALVLVIMGLATLGSATSFAATMSRMPVSPLPARTSRHRASSATDASTSSSSDTYLPDGPIWTWGLLSADISELGGRFRQMLSDPNAQKEIRDETRLIALTTAPLLAAVATPESLYLAFDSVLVCLWGCEPFLGSYVHGKAELGAQLLLSDAHLGQPLNKVTLSVDGVPVTVHPSGVSFSDEAR